MKEVELNISCILFKGVNLSVPEGSPMRQTRSSMSGAVIEGLDLSNL